MVSKDIKTKIREYFFVNPSTRLRVRNIESVLKLPLPSVIRYTKELESEGVLKKVEVGNVIFYTADRSNIKFTLQKRLFNINRIYGSGLIEFLKKEFNNPTIVLFGSYSLGEDVENSDIDLYLETRSNKNVNLSSYEKILGRHVQVFIHKNIDEIKNKDLANNILNGITLSGFLEVIK